MPILLEGKIREEERVLTGLYGVDRALGFLGNLGAPLRAIYEIYGREQSGKSTLALYLAARVKPTGKIVVADLEDSYRQSPHIERAVHNAGFSGTVRIVPSMDEKKKGRPHEDILEEAADSLLEDDVNACIIDSLGMFVTIAEAEADLEDRNVGSRAFETARLTRRLISRLGTVVEPKLAIYVNHIQSVIGGRGHTTPAGDTKKYGATVRLWMFRADSDFEHGAFEAQVKVEKLRWGGHGDRIASVFVIPGVGVHVGMTAVMDCLRGGLAKRENVVKVKSIIRGEEEWKSAGRMKQLVEWAIEGDEAKFNSFQRALKGDEDE